jgi:hypothetical protein
LHEHAPPVPNLQNEVTPEVTPEIGPNFPQNGSCGLRKDTAFEGRVFGRTPIS